MMKHGIGNYFRFRSLQYRKYMVTILSPIFLVSARDLGE